MSTSATQQVWRKAFTHTASVPLILMRMKGASTDPSAFSSKPLGARQERSEEHGSAGHKTFWRERALSEVTAAQSLMQTHGLYLDVSTWASRLSILTVCWTWMQHEMSAELCINSGGQKPPVLGTWFPIPSTANRVLSRACAHGLVCSPDGMSSSFIKTHPGDTWHFTRTGQVMFRSIRVLARF